MTASSLVRRRLISGAIATVGLVVAGVCGWLGMWQAQVFTGQGVQAAASAAAAPAVRLDASHTGDAVGELWGRTVIVTGTYVPSQEVQIVGADGVRRILTALLLDDGRVVAVVRGLAPPSPPPTGTVTQTGVFLPTEAQADHPVPAGSYGSVRLQALAQVWRQPLVAGYVTLGEADATAQGMRPATVVLPTYDGQSRNGGYALQWWAFGVFGLAMSVVFARNYHRRGLALADPVDEPGSLSEAPNEGSSSE